ncbi:hypothetical protein FB451DRAFT_1453744 [Mycena latifolia]|nr:hypothetical protein FB451DRAFT_1453744 [Mycena latifolia]
MPRKTSIAQMRFKNTVLRLDDAVTTLEVVSDNLGTSFLKPISNTARSLMRTVQTVRRNKDDCTDMLEKIHRLLYEIIRLHITSNTGGELSPDMLESLAQFTETLHKIHTFAEAQQDKSIIKHFFRQGEMSKLLKGCHLGLEKALDKFNVQAIHILRDMAQMQQYAQKTHEEILELISSHSDEVGVYPHVFQGSQQIFHGPRKGSTEDIDKVLLLTDNMPLAIDLAANLVDYEGFSTVFERWKTERTSLFSEGHNRGSNLDLSISMSLSSSRIMAVPQSRELLSLLSILPDGLSDIELVQSELPVNNILACKAALLRTSLAYVDGQKQLKVLVPIREYVHKMHPPMVHIVQPLFNHFHRLLEIHEMYHGTVSSPGIVARITSNFANIHAILLKGLSSANPDLVKTIYSIYCLLDQALGHFLHFDDTDLQCRFHDTIADYYRFHSSDVHRALCLAQTGLALAVSTGNTKRQSDLLATLALITWQTGDYSAARSHAYESQRLAKVSADLYREAWGLRIEAMCCDALGSYSCSISLLKRARDLLGLCGMSGGQLDHVIMSDQAEIHQLKSEYVEARNIQSQILHNISFEQDPYQHAFALLNIAQIDVEINAPIHDVQSNINQAKSQFRSVGNPQGEIFCETIQASLAAREGEVGVAEALFKRCLKFAWDKDSAAVNYCLERLGDVRLCLKTKQLIKVYKALQFLGDMCMADGDQHTALSLFTVSLEGFTQMDVHRSRAECMLCLGDILNLHGDLVNAVELWKIARPLFERSSQAKLSAQIDERLSGNIFNILQHPHTVVQGPPDTTL